MGAKKHKQGVCLRAGTFFAPVHILPVRSRKDGIAMDMQEMVRQLKEKPELVQQVMQSADGQRLMTLLNGSDGGNNFRQAAQSATGGNTAQMARMLKGLMESPEGADLIRRIGGQLSR